MFLLAVVLLAITNLSLSWAKNAGAVTITVDGQQTTKYVLTTSTDGVTVNGNIITLHGGARVYLGNYPNDTFSTNCFYQADLFGKRLKVTMDLSEVGCNCNGAIYTVSMPAYNSDQKPEPGKGDDFYCDANQVGGTFCPEMDVSEANKYAMASTPHTCTYDAPHYYPTCDKGGCGDNVLQSHGNDFGPGKTIDTNKPFTLSVSFINSGNPPELSVVNNYFWQDGKNIQFNSCNSNYLQWMGKSLPGMVMTMSLWGTGPGGMSWLDGRSGCQGGCNLDASRVIFSDITIESL